MGGEVGDAEVGDAAAGDEIGHRVKGVFISYCVFPLRGGGDAPVHEVEVEVGELEFGKGGVEGGGDFRGGVVVVPELAGDPEVRAGEAGFC